MNLPSVSDAIARTLDGVSLDRFLELMQIVQQKSVVPYVGAGMSVCAGYPCWADFCEAVSKQAPFSGRDAVPTTLSFAKMLERYADVGWLTDFIERMFGPTRHRINFQEYPVGRLAKLRPSLIVTTNYDPVLEQVFGDSLAGVFTGSAIDTRTYRNVLRASGSTDTALLKVHGSFDLDVGLIATHEQYRKAYHRRGKVRQLLLHLMTARSLLFLGCSLSADDEPVKLLRSLTTQLGDFAQRHYIIRQWIDDEKLVRQEEARLATLSVKAIWYRGSHEQSLGRLLDVLSRKVQQPERVAGETKNVSSEALSILGWLLTTLPECEFLSVDGWISFRRQVEKSGLADDLTVHADLERGALSFKCRQGYLYEQGRRSVEIPLSHPALPVTYRFPRSAFSKEAVKAIEITHVVGEGLLRVEWNDHVLAECPISFREEKSRIKLQRAH